MTRTAWMKASAMVGLLALLCLHPAPASEAASRPPVTSERGMVVTSQRLASDVGAEILRGGGNAVDAAVAVGYALAVVNPCCGNIGGGGFATLHLADGRDIFLNFRERAPLAAHRDHVSRRQGRGDRGPQPQGLQGRGRSRHGAGARYIADALWNDAARGRHGAGHPAGARGLRAGPGRRRHPCARHGRPCGRSPTPRQSSSSRASRWRQETGSSRRTWRQASPPSPRRGPMPSTRGRLPRRSWKPAPPTAASSRARISHPTR